MIKYHEGDLLLVNQGVIVHGCNAQGVMGSGVALAVKNTYPIAYEAYKNFEKQHGLRTGSLSIQKVSTALYIANAVTQERYGRDPNIRYVSYGAVHLCFERLHEHFPKSMPFHFPKIGSGLGNGDWEKISKLIEFACPDRDLFCWLL